MLTLDSGRLAAATIPIGTGWLLGTCMEARGKQDLWVKQKPDVLAALRDQAMIQSAESSNRIEFSSWRVSVNSWHRQISPIVTVLSLLPNQLKTVPVNEMNILPGFHGEVTAAGN